MEKIISSSQNRYIKNIKRLSKSKKYRKETGCFLIEGFRLLNEAFARDFPLEYVVIGNKAKSRSEGLQLIDSFLEKDIDIFYMNDDLMQSIAETDNPQGILAVAFQNESSLADIIHKSFNEKFVLIIDGVQDPGNLGTIIRTAEAAGVSGVICTVDTVDAYNGKTVRSAMGSLFGMQLVTGCRPKEIVDEIKRTDINLLVADLSAETYYYQVDFLGESGLVVGNENAGPAEEFKQSGHLIKIPCSTESLNVAVAAGILLYERVRGQKDEVTSG